MGVRKPLVVVLTGAAMMIGLVAASANPATTTAAPKAVAVRATVVGRYSTPEEYLSLTTDDRFLAAIHHMNRGTLFQGDDSVLVGAAKSFCENGADGSPLDSMTADEVRGRFGMDAYDARAVMRTMAAYYCPDRIGNIG